MGVIFFGTPGIRESNCAAKFIDMSDIYEISMRYFWDIPDINLRYPELDPRLPDSYLRYVRDMPKICLWYAWEIADL